MAMKKKVAKKMTGEYKSPAAKRKHEKAEPMAKKKAEAKKGKS